MGTPQFHLRPAIVADLDAVLALERATALAPHWPPSTYADILGSTDLGATSIALGAPSIPRSLRNGWETATQRCFFVAEKDASLAGFAVGVLHPAASERIAELESVVVSANARRAGIGQLPRRARLVPRAWRNRTHSRGPRRQLRRHRPLRRPRIHAHRPPHALLPRPRRRRAPHAPPVAVERRPN